jgi:hypothetical protein
MKEDIVIAISQSDISPWREIRKTQQDTWIKNFDNDAVIIHYLSKNPSLILKIVDSFIENYRFSKKLGKIISVLNRLIAIFISSKIPKYIFDKNKNELLVDSNSTYFLFGRRNLALYEWFVENTNSKFLFQTNTSSYINVAKLKSITKKLDDRSLIFAGMIINPNSQSFKIVSGAGRLLSRDLVIEILKHRNHLEFNNLEDICVSELISKMPVRIIPLERYDLLTINKLNHLPDEVLSKYFHFRCKSQGIPRTDSNIMFALHQRLSNF